MTMIERIQKLNKRLQEMDRRAVPSWERPILEVARQALLQEIATIGVEAARWHYSPAFLSRRAS